MKNSLTKKRVVVAKITKIEMSLLENHKYEKTALITAMGLLEKVHVKLWADIKKDYKIKTDKVLLIDDKTREVYYEDF